jgi:hypothetical protein
MTAKEIAEKYAGKIVKCSITKSAPIDSDGVATKTFEGRIVGWKKGINGDPEFVAVEVQPPGKTNFLIAHFMSGYIWTTTTDKGLYAKKLLPEEIVLDGVSITTSKHIGDWPHSCPECGKPAQIFMLRIDCSNSSCRHKFRTADSADLFIPKNPKNAKPEIMKAPPQLMPKPKAKALVKPRIPRPAPKLKPKRKP